MQCTNWTKGIWVKFDSKTLLNKMPFLAASYIDYNFVIINTLVEIKNKNVK